MLHECLTGESLYAGQVPVLRLVEPPRPPSAHNPEVSAALDAVCMKALAIDPTERFASARELARALTDATAAVADDEALSALMAQLFPGQRTSLAQLADTAKDPRQSGVRLSKLAHQALQLETRPAARADATKGPVPRRVKAAAKTAPMQPAPVPAEEPRAPARRPSYGMLGLVLLMGAGGAAGVLHLLQRPTPLVRPPPVVTTAAVPEPPSAVAPGELPRVEPVVTAPLRKTARPGRAAANDPGVSPVALPVAARPEHAARLLALRDQLDDVRGGDRSALEAKYEALEEEALHPGRPGVFEAKAKALEGEVRRTLEAQKLLDSLVNQLPTAPPAEE
jgi:eukaryotic-like serine/threonine-protein kinase